MSGKTAGGIPLTPSSLGDVFEVLDTNDLFTRFSFDICRRIRNSFQMKTSYTCTVLSEMSKREPKKETKGVGKMQHTWQAETAEEVVFVLLDADANAFVLARIVRAQIGRPE